jgi:hypothetical protein
MGLSVFTGVVVHGFRRYQSEDTHYNTWMLMNIIAGGSVYFAQIATARSILKDSSQGTLLSTIARIQALIYMACIAAVHSFSVVKIQIAAGMVPVMIIHFYDYRKGIKGGAWVGIGIALSFFSAVFHTLKLTISERWFNYNDISHVFIGASFVLISAGIRIRYRTAEQIISQHLP